MVERPESRTVTVLLFDGFEVLDVFGPVEIFSKVPEWSIEFAGPVAGDLVRSAQGAEILAPLSLADISQRPGGVDILLVPGGKGRISLVTQPRSLALIKAAAQNSTIVSTVCTGSGILAAADALQGKKATSNKLAWDWVITQGENVTWVPEARWVVDGNLWSASGVAAGMDAAHALVSALVGNSVADEIANAIELEVHRDPIWDPFARIHGTV